MALHAATFVFRMLIILRRIWKGNKSPSTVISFSFTTAVIDHVTWFMWFRRLHYQLLKLSKSKQKRKVPFPAVDLNYCNPLSTITPILPYLLVLEWLSLPLLTRCFYHAPNPSTVTSNSTESSNTTVPLGPWVPRCSSLPVRWSRPTPCSAASSACRSAPPNGKYNWLRLR